MNEDIRKVIENIEESKCREALRILLENYLRPSFGSLLKRDIDLLIFDILKTIGYIEENPSVYSLVQRLRITSSKARTLLYNHELRRLNQEDLDNEVKEALKSPVIQKQGDLFVLQIENPLVIDHLRFKLKKLGYATDGSFSPYLIRISVNAITSLIDHYIEEDYKKEIYEKLREEGIKIRENFSLKNFLLEFIKHKFQEKMGSEAAAEIVSFIKELLNNRKGINNIIKEIKKIIA
ncbi:MAG: hypothetical protein Q9M35_00115 [Rhodothermus sp.]|nr:hypothetical protein [Rhodothermus sp.]